MAENPGDNGKFRIFNRRSIAFTLVLFLFAGAAGGLGYFQFVVKPAMIANMIRSAPQPVATVATSEAKSEQWKMKLHAVGTFRAQLGIEITPQVGGVIAGLNFESGQDVKKGDLLIQIDDSVDQADLTANLATLKNAELTAARQQKLIGGGYTPQSTLDAALAQRDSAAAAVQRTQALIQQKKLVAPFDGRVGLRKVDLGQYVSPGTAIVTLQQLDSIFVDFPLPEQAVANLSVGQVVEVKVAAWPGRTFQGKIAAIDARVNADTRNVQVRAVFQNDDKKLLPGMFADVDVIVGAAKSVVTLPRTSIVDSLSGQTVFVVKPRPGDGALVVERRVVKTGETRQDSIEIVSGVNPGEQIVSEGQLKLTDNARVQVNNFLSLPEATERPKE